ncbi:MAG: glycosyltransferase family 2 protein [Planctomycetes bacterium]|nr:glycosyltransferase family 2 protein [Planctomycetota bacterium]
MKPTVSVLIAARDYGQYLADALRSVQRQTFSDWELILIDDGSRDNTPEVARPFLNDPRIQYHRTDTLGQPRAKNLALQLARAELVAYLDGDDLWMPTKLERQVRLMQADPRLGVTFTRRLLIDPQGGIIPSSHPPLPRGMVYNDILLDNFVCFSSVMIRKEVLEHVGAFDPRLELAIDYDLWLRVANHYPFDFIDEALVKYRTGHGNLSKRIVERITSVLSTMRRSLARRGNAVMVPAEVQREAWGSTCRTMAFVRREDNPLNAARWYWRGARHDRRWGSSIKSMVRCLWNGVRG